jgi:hypothetical protein
MIQHEEEDLDEAGQRRCSTPFPIAIMAEEGDEKETQECATKARSMITKHQVREEGQPILVQRGLLGHNPLPKPAPQIPKDQCAAPLFQ